jgi:hypothetical protein
MLKITNIDKILGETYGKYKIHSVNDFTKSYSFAVLDTEDNRYFRIDLMKKEGIHGAYELRYSPSRYFNLFNETIENIKWLVQDMAELIVKHRKPIKLIC